MKIWQILKFEKMVSPWLLQLLFWRAAADLHLWRVAETWEPKTASTTHLLTSG